MGRINTEWFPINVGSIDNIKMLIENRHKLDKTYIGKSIGNGSVIDSSLINDFEEEIICTYITLEELIKTASLNDNHRRMINFLMLGYTYNDLEIYFKQNVGYIKVIMNNVYKRIYKEYLYRYEEWVHINGLVKIDDETKYKKCKDCGKDFPNNFSFFKPNENLLDGLENSCRFCRQKKTLKKL